MNNNNDTSSMRPRYPGNEVVIDDYSLIDELIGGKCACKQNSNGNTDCALPEFPYNVPQAMVYSPDQCFDMLYDTDTALERGTLFKALDLPFGGISIV